MWGVLTFFSKRPHFKDCLNLIVIGVSIGIDVITTNHVGTVYSSDIHVLILPIVLPLIIIAVLISSFVCVRFICIPLIAVTRGHPQT